MIEWVSKFWMFWMFSSRARMQKRRQVNASLFWPDVHHTRVNDALVRTGSEEDQIHFFIHVTSRITWQIINRLEQWLAGRANHEGANPFHVNRLRHGNYVDTSITYPLLFRKRRLYHIMKNYKKIIISVTAIFSLYRFFVPIQIDELCGKNYEATLLSMIDYGMYRRRIWNAHLVTGSDQFHMVPPLCHPLLGPSVKDFLSYSTCIFIVA